jgi:hypothetical protein
LKGALLFGASVMDLELSAKFVTFLSKLLLKELASGDGFEIGGINFVTELSDRIWSQFGKS